MAFPIANKNNPKTFLPPQEAREKVNNHHQPSHKNFVSVIPDTWKNAEKKDALLRDKETHEYFKLFIFFIFFWSGFRNQIACSLLGGISPIPEQRLPSH